MTTPASILSLVRNHAEAALSGLVILIIVAAIWGANVSGKHTQAAIDAEAVTHAATVARAEATAEAIRAVNVVKAQNDSLHARNDSLATRNEALTHASNTKLTSARLVNARLSVKDDTASVTTDSGIVRVPVPHVLAAQLAAERMATDSAFSAMEHKIQSDDDRIAGLVNENDGLHTQIQLDSVVQNRYRAEVAAAIAETDAANKQARPRFSFVQGAVVGVLGTLGAIVIAAVAF